MKDQSKTDEWADLIEAAKCTVEGAERGDTLSGLAIVRECAIGLRDLLGREALPNPRSAIYLKSLIESLDAITAGVDADLALHVRKPKHRLASPDAGPIEALLFVMVGKTLDELKNKGDTRIDKPVAKAIAEVSKKQKISRTTIQKAWSNLGAERGWETSRDDWKG